MGSSAPQARVLVASGEEVLARSIETILAPAGFTVLQAFTGQTARDLARHDPPDAFIIDSQAPDLDGLGLCRILRTDPRITAATPIVLITPHLPGGGARRNQDDGRGGR